MRRSRRQTHANVQAGDPQDGTGAVHGPAIIQLLSGCLSSKVLPTSSPVYLRVASSPTTSKRLTSIHHNTADVHLQTAAHRTLRLLHPQDIYSSLDRGSLPGLSSTAPTYPRIVSHRTVIPLLVCRCVITELAICISSPKLACSRSICVFHLEMIPGWKVVSPH